MEDRSLVLRCQQGSREALRCIYEKYRDSLLILAVALSHDGSIAEDAVQDTFVGFAENVGRFELTGSLKAYLGTCVANRIRDIMRKQRSKTMAACRDCSTAVDLNEPGRRLAWNEELQRLSSALAKLPDEQREVIVLRIYGQVRLRAIAKALGVSVNTVKGRYRYGINKLRSILNSEVKK